VIGPHIQIAGAARRCMLLRGILLGELVLAHGTSPLVVVGWSAARRRR
jgi:hypothetical protein